MDIPSAPAAALWAGLHLILLLVLSILVTRQRQKHRVPIGDGGAPELMQAIRAFGNAAEYVPAGIAAMAVMAVAGAPGLAVHITGVLLLVGRVLHAVALSRSPGLTLARGIGMSITWVAFLFAAVALLFYAMV